MILGPLCIFAVHQINSVNLLLPYHEHVPYVTDLVVGCHNKSLLVLRELIS